MKLRRGSVIILILAGIMPLLVRAGTLSFDTNTPGIAPSLCITGITGTGTSLWTVAVDETAPSPNHVLRQSAWTPNPSFPWCVITNSTMTNGFVETAFKPISGTNDQAAGVLWRFRDSNNYYVARANALENNVVLYKIQNGKRTALDIMGRQGGYGVTASVPVKQWSRMRVDFDGPLFRVSLNGRELFTVNDDTFPDAGLVGLWTKADSVTLFDDVNYGINTAKSASR